MYKMSESQVEQASWYMVLGNILPIRKPDLDNNTPELDTPSVHDSDNKPELDTLAADLVDTEIEELECEEVADYPPGRPYVGVAVLTMFALLGTVVASTVKPFIGISITATALIILILIIDRSVIDIATCWILVFTTLTVLNTAIGVLIFTEPAVALALVILSSCMIMSLLARVTLHTSADTSQADHTQDIEFATL